MESSKRSIIPFWLSLTLAITFVITAIVVSAFAYLSLEAFLNRPLNPLAEAAEAVDEVVLTPLPQEGLAPVPVLPAGEPTPTLIPTSSPEPESEPARPLEQSQADHRLDHQMHSAIGATPG